MRKSLPLQGYRCVRLLCGTVTAREADQELADPEAVHSYAQHLIGLHDMDLTAPATRDSVHKWLMLLRCRLQHRVASTCSWVIIVWIWLLSSSSSSALTNMKGQRVMPATG